MLARDAILFLLLPTLVEGLVALDVAVVARQRQVFAVDG
jgi:hypothetical protein